MGMPEDKINPLGVSINLFFEAPAMFKEMMPNDFEKYQTIFNLNPLQKKDPVVDKSVVEGVP